MTSGMSGYERVDGGYDLLNFLMRLGRSDRPGKFFNGDLPGNGIALVIPFLVAFLLVCGEDGIVLHPITGQVLLQCVAAGASMRFVREKTEVLTRGACERLGGLYLSYLQVKGKVSAR